MSDPTSEGRKIMPVGGQEKVFLCVIDHHLISAAVTDKMDARGESG